jgi:hypothetical protein
LKKSNLAPLIIATISSSIFIIWAIYKISLHEKFGDLPLIVAILIWGAYFTHTQIGFSAIIAFFKSKSI